MFACDILLKTEAKELCRTYVFPQFCPQGNTTVPHLPPTSSSFYLPLTERFNFTNKVFCCSGPRCSLFCRGIPRLFILHSYLVFRVYHSNAWWKLLTRPSFHRSLAWHPLADVPEWQNHNWREEALPYKYVEYYINVDGLTFLEPNFLNMILRKSFFFKLRLCLFAVSVSY